MIRKGEEYTCDRCGKMMFIEDGAPERKQWYKISFEIDGPIIGRKSMPEKLLCYKCRDELDDILDEFFDGDNIAR